LRTITPDELGIGMLGVHIEGPVGKANQHGEPYLTYTLAGMKTEGEPDFIRALNEQEAIDRFRSAVIMAIQTWVERNRHWPQVYWRLYPTITRDEDGWRIRARFVISKMLPTPINVAAQPDMPERV